MLFEGCDFYPSGGIRDFTRSGSNLDKLIEEAKRENCDWWHIFDSHEMKTVKSQNRSH
ncbi:MAG: hypothetical protein K0U78_14895 [Actinomycetia bacterium]|nr:hypothetical protein [Actinomycetes bacterium]